MDVRKYGIKNDSVHSTCNSNHLLTRILSFSKRYNSTLMPFAYKILKPDEYNRHKIKSLN